VAFTDCRPPDLGGRLFGLCGLAFFPTATWLPLPYGESTYGRVCLSIIIGSWTGINEGWSGWPCWVTIGPVDGLPGTTMGCVVVIWRNSLLNKTRMYSVSSMPTCSSLGREEFDQRIGGRNHFAHSIILDNKIPCENEFDET
jgi:hypothetical protein